MFVRYAFSRLTAGLSRNSTYTLRFGSTFFRTGSRFPTKTGFCYIWERNFDCSLKGTVWGARVKILELDLKIIDHPSYSPDFLPTDFDRFLLSRLLCKRQKWIKTEMAKVYRCLRSILWIINLLFYSKNNKANLWIWTSNFILNVPIFMQL